MAVQEKLYTADDLWELSRREHDKRYELIEGELIESNDRSIDVYAPHKRVETLEGDAILDLSNVIPGFSLTLREIFSIFED